MLESTSLTTNLVLHCNGLLEECLSIKHANKNIILCAADPGEEFYEIIYNIIDVVASFLNI